MRKEKLETLLALETARVHSELGEICRNLDLKPFKMLFVLKGKPVPIYEEVKFNFSKCYFN